MKKILLAGIAAAALFGAPTLAADMPMKAAPLATFNWSGCYIGAGAGELRGVAEPLTTIFAESKPHGFVGGGQVGCNYQASNWVVGLQGDFSGSSARNSQTVIIGLLTETFDAKIDWFASATARLGYAWDRWLVYGKGGSAWVRDELRDSGVGLIFPFNFTGSQTRSGWTVGGGLEYGLTPSWSLALEYDHYNFGTKSVTLSGFSGPGGVPGSETAQLRQSFSVVKAVINYRFGTSN